MDTKLFTGGVCLLTDPQIITALYVPRFMGQTLFVAETLQGDWCYFFGWKSLLNSHQFSCRTCLQFILQVLPDFADHEDSTIVY